MIPDTIRNAVYELEGIASLLDEADPMEDVARTSNLLALAYEKLEDVQTRLDHISNLVSPAAEVEAEDSTRECEEIASEETATALEFKNMSETSESEPSQSLEAIGRREIDSVKDKAEGQAEDSEQYMTPGIEQEPAEEMDHQEKIPEEHVDGSGQPGASVVAGDVEIEAQRETAANAEFEEKEEAHTDVNTQAFVKSIGSAKAAFSLNDTFRFRRELFHGDNEAWQSALADIEDAEDAEALRIWLAECYNLPDGSPDTEDFLDIAVAYVKGQKG